MSAVPLSVLDLAVVAPGESVRDGLDGCVALARRAERLGYHRIWYAEHHNMASIASSATSVLIAHVAAHTDSIRLGAGGVMLPNHSPLVIAEQFGTLATLHPGRIDLGLGRAPGTDQETLRALRRSPAAAETFPQDVVELQGYLTDRTRIPGVNATPGRGTDVPLYILGSSLFGAQLAAHLGLPFGFASHFAPHSLQQAVAIYRSTFQPSEQLDSPYVVAGVTVIAADTQAQADAELQAVRRMRVQTFFGRGRAPLTEDEIDLVLASPQMAHIDEMLTYAAIGTREVVRDYLEQFREHADADELMVVHQASSVASRLRSLDILADAMSLTAASA
ncbi:LLM class flavin-dependent oxidoreductase [Longivirga aurantiaca]|uniref:LLM class flavin-dependent oxidoreductase n=1 Tax=Longivirga aurantiaca TaxID=1837743 RepID=A0ABW1SXU2_9ACTN